MRRVRLTVIGVLITVLTFAAFGVLYAPAVNERARAKAAYEQAREDFDAATRERLYLENTVSALRTRVDSVELSARAQFRLIRPGERVEILEETDVLADFLARADGPRS